MTEPEEIVREDHHAIPEAGAFGRWIDRVAILPALGLVASMLILIQEVILRYVFNSPTIWAHETTVFLCASRDRHIRVVLIYDILPPRIRRLFDIVISTVCALSAGAFAWAAWQMVKRAAWRPDGSFRLETSGSAWNPPYPGILKILLMIALAVMAVQFVILAVNYARARR